MIRFSKAHACGNDFLVVEMAAAQNRDLPETARRLCARTSGVGADGIEFLTREGAREGRIRLYNADGSPAEISGNGTRCVAAYLAKEQGLGAGDAVQLETDAGVRECRIEEAAGTRFRIRMGMGAPEVWAHRVTVEGVTVDGAVVGMGNPHFVVFVEDEDFGWGGRSWQELGAAICVHPDFPRGTNVEFLRVMERDRIAIRIYERGVGPTSSSGTGTSASGAAAMALRGAATHLEVAAPGGAQRVEWAGGGEELWLTGPAELIARGEAYWEGEGGR